MPCKKPSPIVILLVNTLLVTLVFLLVDYLYYGLLAPGPIPYHQDLFMKILFTVIMAMAFGHLYNKGSVLWRPNSKVAFVYKDVVVAEGDECRSSWPKIANGIIFSLLTAVVIIMAVTLGSMMLSILYIDILGGIRGDLGAEPMDSAVLAGKLILAGATLEVRGRTEDDPV